MSTGTDPGAEREIDLGRWKQAAVERWWLVAAGLVVGAVIGALYSLSGGSIWQASVLIAPGQPFSPQGSPVLSYTSSPRGIEQVVTSEDALKRAARAAGIGVGTLRGHVSTTTVSTGASASTASRGATLIRITVQLHKPKHAEDARAERRTRADHRAGVCGQDDRALAAQLDPRGRADRLDRRRDRRDRRRHACAAHSQRLARSPRRPRSFSAHATRGPTSRTG